VHNSGISQTNGTQSECSLPCLSGSKIACPIFLCRFSCSPKFSAVCHHKLVTKKHRHWITLKYLR